jgi:NAD(P)-dependent dehydrogenase (short-subunit alcohol dehydrogenase family)
MVKTNSASGAIAFITGANKGLGFETARQLGQMGIKIFMGCRDEQRGREALETLVGEGIDAVYVNLDVTNQDTIDEAVQFVDREVGKLDILVNNAGISIQHSPPSEMAMEELRTTFDTNFFGAFAVTKTFLPLLRKSENACIVNVSSSLGSLFHMSDLQSRVSQQDTIAYAMSKTALDALTVLFASELRSTGIKVNAICPGYTATALNNFTGPQTPEEAVKVIVRYATLPPEGPTGGYFSKDGREPW